VYLRLDAFVPADDGEANPEWDDDDDENTLAEWNAKPHGLGKRILT